MQRLLLFFCFVFSSSQVLSQHDIIRETRMALDTIVMQLDAEMDEDQRMALVLNAYKTRMEAYPLLIIELGQKIFTLSQKNNDPLTESSAWSFYGQGYRLSGNYTKALECHHRAVVLAEKTGNKSLLAIAQNQMAHIYKDREENEKALRLYQTANANARQGKIEEARLWPPMNMGAVLLAMNQLDSSLYYSQQAYDGCIKQNILRNMPYILANMGSAYGKMGNITQSRLFYNQAILAAQESQSARYKNLVYISLAELFQRLKQQDSAVYYAKKAIEVVQNTVFTFLSIKPAKLLTEVYENTNADSTLKYLRLYRTANDSMFNTRTNQQLQIMTFEEDQRQAELAAERIHFRNKIKMNMMLGGLGTILLVALILFRNNNQKQKANQLLRRQKEEIETTLSQLKTAQAQLIQSEKMASLGELTAGIAHEIQNPLNFVNNFSEVNTELIDELQHELKAGKMGEAITLSNNIKENEEKIVHHGKRADAIVKGMLQHSRTSTGIKEPTDINALADEYLRLAYHGLRAKDKSFNATMKTDFDPSIGLINIVPQDIGRVILNLITNAFYAVSAPKPPEGGLRTPNRVQEPTVIVSTKQLKPPSGGLGAIIEISVSDNGPGIPKHILDKIFQPFFTTKPTGQGTGLGLSLSYDIVKAHGGEIKVETIEGEGTEFIIQLPLA